MYMKNLKIKKKRKNFLKICLMFVILIKTNLKKIYMIQRGQGGGGGRV